MTATELERLNHRAANKPKLTNKNCKHCGEPLTDVNVFFQKASCGICEPIYLLHQEKNTWKPEDEIFVNDLKL